MGNWIRSGKKCAIKNRFSNSLPFFNSKEKLQIPPQLIYPTWPFASMVPHHSHSHFLPLNYYPASNLIPLKFPSSFSSQNFLPFHFDQSTPSLTSFYNSTLPPLRSYDNQFHMNPISLPLQSPSLPPPQQLEKGQYFPSVKKSTTLTPLHKILPSSSSTPFSSASSFKKLDLNISDNKKTCSEHNSHSRIMNSALSEEVSHYMNKDTRE